ncbi:MAG: hypothetical protein LBI41_00155 [Lactobacillales bacterium]|jgi:hypothetical protein|nr:hypothetical protein [Lactobacillales bacterium]
MSKHISLLFKEINVHKKNFLLIPYMVIMLFFANQMGFISITTLNQIILNFNFFIPVILLFLVKTEEDQSSRLNSLLTTKYKRRDIIISRYHFTFSFATIAFLANKMIVFICFITDKTNGNTLNFSPIYLGNYLLFIAVLSSILLFLSFFLNIFQFAISAIVTSTILSQVFKFLIDKHLFQNYFQGFFIFLVEIFLAYGIIHIFVYVTELIFSKKDL